MVTKKRTPPKYDVVVWGATGFTGRLVAQHLFQRYGVGADLTWAIGGRNAARLAAIARELSGDENGLPVLVGDSNDAASLDRIAAQTRVICSTVGPFALYGSEMVAACARNGTDYCDITGEVQWIRRMIDAHQATAETSGARIVNCCGFDSIPSDLGCLFLQNEMRQRHGTNCSEIRFRLRKARGAFSGGTVASLLNVMQEARGDRTVRRVLADPYALNPTGERSGPDGNDQRAPAYDSVAGGWTAPFVMAAINTRIVRRSNALLDYEYGRDFRYDESVLCGGGLLGFATASATATALGALLVGVGVAPTRVLLEKLFLPKPGDGPSANARERGFFDILLIGKSPDGELLRAKVYGDRDPGYGATSRMLGEAAVCLATDNIAAGGGFWTPASSMGFDLIERLESAAGMSFDIEPD